MPVAGNGLARNFCADFGPPSMQTKQSNVGSFDSTKGFAGESLLDDHRERRNCEYRQITAGVGKSVTSKRAVLRFPFWETPPGFFRTNH